LKNPQGWNLYSYTINNPLRYTDPTGKYKCVDSADCSSDLDKAFEQARKRLLNSSNPETAAAAKAYGDPNTDNHVSVTFVGGDTGGTGLKYNNAGKSVTYQITVSIPGSHVDVALDVDVGHEGSHVGTDQAFAASLTPYGGGPDPAKDVTLYSTENAAYHVNASIIQATGDSRSLDMHQQYPINPSDSIAQVDATINRYLADPTSGYGVTPDNPGPKLSEKSDQR
jgi:hypothetical protein